MSTPLCHSGLTRAEVVVMMKAHRRVCDASVSQMSNWGLQLFSWPLKVHKQLHTQLTQNKDRLIKNTLWSWWQVRENVMQQTVKAGRAQKVFCCSVETISLINKRICLCGAGLSFCCVPFIQSALHLVGLGLLLIMQSQAWSSLDECFR